MSNKAYIFDLDGVLVNNCRYHVLAWRVFSKKHGFELTDEQVLEWMGAANRVYMERLLGRPVAGIQAAHAAGMRVVAITTTNPRATLESAGADCIIESFTELCGARGARALPNGGGASGGRALPR